MAVTLFGSNTPTTPDAPPDGIGLTLASRIRALSNGTITRVGWFTGLTLPSQPVPWFLLRYDVATDGPGAAIANGTFAGLVAGAWNWADITPFAVTALDEFIVEIWTRDRYAASPTFFAADVTNASGTLVGPADSPGSTPARRNGRFFQAGTPQYANQGFNATAYFVDITFEPSAASVTGVGVATGSGVAEVPAVAVSPSAALSAGAGAALDATMTTSLGVGTASGVGAALDPSIETEGDVHLYTFGPCEPWDPIWNCNISLITGAAEVTGVAVQAASEVLYQLTAQRFGLCNVKLRPCRKSCQGGFPWWSWWEYGSYPQPYWWNGTWFNLACGSCPGDSCSCVGLSEIELPGPVHSITEVKLNGVVLTAGVDYRVDNYRTLVRLGGDPWPFCQDLSLEDTEDNTMSVTANYGEAVPIIGRMAVGELGLEFVRYLTCDDECQLPFGVVDVSRQGISMTIQNTAELIKEGILNLPMAAMFIQAANPEHLTARAAVYDLDAPTYRAVGT